MRDTKLILIDGIPGSGKSTLAHFLTRVFTQQEIKHTWWYEEDKQHPLYFFHDATSLQLLLDTLQVGNYRQVISGVLAKWRLLVEQLQHSDRIGIIDGCLFGYLTWTLFPMNIAPEEIQAYLAQVEEIIRPLNPALIYLYQDNVSEALKRICVRRGTVETHYIQNAVDSLYGQSRSLQGFSGMVTYWQDYRVLTDVAFARIGYSKLAIENSARAWELYEHQTLQFLELPQQTQNIYIPVELERFAGTYFYQEDEYKQTCVVSCEQDQLVLDGIADLWPHSRLIPLALNTFAIESFPLQICFIEHISGSIDHLEISGPELLSGLNTRTFMREL